MEKFDTKQFEKEAELWQKVNPRPITARALNCTRTFE
jgi:hypothetical protein